MLLDPEASRGHQDRINPKLAVCRDRPVMELKPNRLADFHSNSLIAIEEGFSVDEVTSIASFVQRHQGLPRNHSTNRRFCRFGVPGHHTGSQQFHPFDQCQPSDIASSIDRTTTSGCDHQSFVNTCTTRQPKLVSTIGWVTDRSSTPAIRDRCSVSTSTATR